MLDSGDAVPSCAYGCAPYRLTHLGGQSLLGDYVETVGAAEDAVVKDCDSEYFTVDVYEDISNEKS